MKFFLIKTISILFMIAVVMSCKTPQKVKYASKDLYVAGAKSGKNYVRYSVKLTETNDFDIQEVTLLEYDKPLKYAYYNKTTHVSTSVKKTPFPKGTYIISFDVEDEKIFEHNDKVVVKVLIAGKINKQILVVQKGKTIVQK